MHSIRRLLVWSVERSVPSHHPTCPTDTHPFPHALSQIILLGEDHTSYWTDILHSGLKATSPPDVYKSQEPRLRSFAAAKGTILIFEDLAAVSELGHRTPFIKDFTRDWSLQSSGMLQVNLWNLITNLGYGANLQHVGPMVGQTVEDEIKRRWLGVDNNGAKWKLNAELVFGFREGEPKQKTFVDKQRVFAFGHGNEQ